MLSAEVAADGHVEFALSGPADSHAFVVLAPPLRGDEQMRAGIYGVHCSEDMPAELHERGAGTQVQGAIGPEGLRGRIAPSRLAQLPSPLILQALATAIGEDDMQLRTSNAVVVQWSRNKVSVSPFVTSWAIWRALPRFALVVIVPLLFVGLVGRLRRLPRWGLPALLTLVVVLRIAQPDAAPLLPRLLADEIEQLERQFDCGLDDAIEFVRAQARSTAPLYIQLSLAPTPPALEIRAHWLRLLPRTTSLTADQSAERGLLVRLARVDAPPSGELLLRSKQFCIWGIGGQR